MILTPGYKELQDLYALSSDGGDPWGSAIGFHFAIAEVLYHSGDGDVPSAWQFRDSPAHTDADYEYDGWPDSEIYDLVVAYGSVDSDDLRAFGNVMARYLDILRMAGKDY